MTGFYGEAPTDLGELALPEWAEFMHYLYLPVRIPERDGARVGLGIDCDAHRVPTGSQFAVPERLGFLGPHLWTAIRDAAATAPHLSDPYVYVTARRGFATPGNPLNRPGWHCDDFGGTDLNYIWSDRWPTRFLLSDGVPLHVSADDVESMDDMNRLASIATNHPAGTGLPRIASGFTEHLTRLTPYVIHDTPIIEPPGGMRSFFKISISTHRYDLIGNSHNHLLDYDWPMHSREALRNQPNGGNRDYSR